MKFINVMTNKEFIEGEDYDLLNGRVIFSEKYLKERGECCGGKCEFCPYTDNTKGNKELKK
jgi:hypothetical protein